jgi:ferredoxin
MAESFYVDEVECITCGTCAEICPDCFTLEESMEAAEVTSFDCPTDLIQEAMDNCPVTCIHWGEE